MGLCGNLSVITTFGGGGTQLQVIMPELANLIKVRLTFAKVSMITPLVIINFLNFDTINLLSNGMSFFVSTISSQTL